MAKAWEYVLDSIKKPGKLSVPPQASALLIKEMQAHHTGRLLNTRQAAVVGLERNMT